MAEQWYTIRTTPGAQRSARAGEGSELMESIIERNLRNEGFKVFMPTVHYEARHHRTKKWVERRIPLLVGYAFVDIGGRHFEDVRQVEGVMCFLRKSRTSGPYQMPNHEIGKLLAIEEENRGIIVKQRAKREARERRGLNQTTRKEREEKMPAGTLATICGKNPFSGLIAKVIGPSSRGKVKAVIETLDNLLELDIPLENLEAVA
jgi:transcription antitermination factor NusG